MQGSDTGWACTGAPMGAPLNGPMLIPTLVHLHQMLFPAATTYFIPLESIHTSLPYWLILYYNLTFVIEPYIYYKQHEEYFIFVHFQH